MADYDNRYYSGHHDPYYSRAQGSSRYSNLNQGGYNYSYDPRYSNYAANPPLPKRSSANHSRSDSWNKPKWPPRPSVEDEIEALAKEFPSVSLDGESSGEAPLRGSVDQLPIIEEIERRPQYDNYEKRFVLVSDPSTYNGSTSAASSSSRDSRRRSIAERGNMPHLNTDVDEPPVFTGRTPTPYAYSKPSKESIAPSRGDYFLSPEPMTPTGSSIPRSMSQKDAWDARRDQNTRPSTAAQSRYESTAQPPRSPKNYVFDDSDVEAEDATHLRAERKPARYSFMKGDVQKDDLRTNLRDLKTDNEGPNPSPAQYTSKSTRDSAYSGSSGSSKNSSPPTRSPRSSASSIHNGYSRPKPSRVPTFDRSSTQNSTAYPDSRPVSRESSPLPRDRHARIPSPHPPTGPSLRGEANPSPRDRHARIPSPHPPTGPSLRGEANPPPQYASSKFPTFRDDELLNVSRPSSRGVSRPPTPLSQSTVPQVPTNESNRHSTYPLVTNDRSPPPSRFGRHDTAPLPVPPRIDVQSPSPARQPYPSGPSPFPTGPLPYPVDERSSAAFMPSEAYYQVPTPYTMPPSSPLQRSPYPDSPNMPSSPVIASPHDPASYYRAPTSNPYTKVDDVPRSTRVRSDSARSQTANDARRPERKQQLSVDKPLPSCPRRDVTDKFDDWYTLENCPNFDVCPSCYEATFADTPFAAFFKQSRLYQVPVARICDFSSPWMRLAWLLTIKQKRRSLDLLYSLATIADTEKECPGERELPGPWYGLPDPRDGVPIENFTICPCDLRQIEALFPSLRGGFVRVPPDPRNPKSYKCSLRVSSRRFPKYLDILVEIDNTAQKRNRAPDMEPILRMARENAFKMECSREKTSIRKPWHFIPALPEFTVCEECYDEVVWPAIKNGTRLGSMFNRTLQLVPDEGSHGSSCCLYSPRMRKVWERAVEDEDFAYLKRKAIERKRVESRLAMEKAGLLKIMEGRANLDYAGSDWEKLRRSLKAVESEWKDWE